MRFHTAHPSIRVLLQAGALVSLTTACGSEPEPETVAETQGGITRGPADMVSDLGWRVGGDVRLAADHAGRTVHRRWRCAEFRHRRVCEPIGGIGRGTV